MQKKKEVSRWFIEREFGKKFDLAKNWISEDLERDTRLGAGADGDLFDLGMTRTLRDFCTNQRTFKSNFAAGNATNLKLATKR